MKEKIKKILKYTPKSPNLWFYLLSMACIMMQLLAVSHQFNKIVDPEWLSHTAMGDKAMLAVNSLADALFLLTPLVLLPPRWRKWSWIVMWLVTLWCLAQFLYMPTYRDLMPLSSFFMTENMGGTLWTSIVGSIKPRILEVILPPLMLYAIYRIWLKKPMEKVQQPSKHRLLFAAAGIAGFVVIRLGATAIHQSDNDEPTTFAQQFTDDYCVMWTRQGDYMNLNGAVPYVIYGGITSIFDTKTLSEEEKKQVEQFIEHQPHYTDNDYATARGKNVILLVVESLNSWAVNMQIQGRDVAPTLKQLCSDSTCLVSLAMKSQVKNGRSSDGIFMYNTGLLPLNTKVVANSYSNASYPTLCKALGNYDTFYACCDEPSLWNVKNMAKTYGYSSFYCKDEINDAIKRNNYLLDKTLLEEVTEIIPTRKQPFMALVATAGMHHPFDEAMEPATWIMNSGEYTREVRCYLERVNAFDTALANFINQLKQQGIYDNTMIVIVSDHNEMVDDAPNGRPAIDKEGDDCVMLILNSGQSGRINGPIGQIDIYPTLLDLLGLNSQSWKGLGYSVLRKNITSVATAPTLSAGNSPLISRQKEAWRVSDLIITSRWFDEK
ncbi:MAG: LTA synthase family protein [Muribaculaceae bacterium]|nr:LTA synthase family protein [Muribaculaceae bacterium]